jgi:hypothetical protein
MDIRAKSLVAALTIAIVGCTGSTAVSKQPSQAEIQQGIERRMADIDKMQISPEAKERMKQQIRGSQGEAPR